MKKIVWLVIGLAAAGAAGVARGETYHFSGSGSLLQLIIDYIDDGDVLMVGPGTYSSISTGNKRIRIESTHGPEVTLIDGGNSERCATLGSLATHTDTVLAGFTLTNGVATNGGGGSYAGTLTNCVLSGNSANGGGGGSYYGILTDCTLSGNTTSFYGGGARYGTLTGCTLSGNRATSWFGGGASDATLNNCLLTGNEAGNNGGGAEGGTLTGCTITLNNVITDRNGGGIRGSTVRNCIVWGNTRAKTTVDNYSGGSFTHSCAFPLPGGVGNIAEDPLFMDAENGNFRLQSVSPCVNTGDDTLATGFDLDGNPRIQGLAVDMGCYERFFPLGDLHVDVKRPDDSGDGTTWATAKKTIQAAIDAAQAGNLILVHNGEYGAVTATNQAITIQSVNGAATTVIDGNGAAPAASLGTLTTHTATVLAGFTLRNGRYTYGGGVAYGTANDCVITNNTASGGGGSYRGVRNRCLIAGNFAGDGGGVRHGVLNNCAIIGNTAYQNGGGAYGGTLNNCTVADNTADVGGGGTYDDGGLYPCVVNNSIVWGNTVGGAANNHNSAGTFRHTCTTPAPEGGANTMNIAAAPRFVGNGDYRLQGNSPCLNKGDNTRVVGAFDLDGNPRVFGDTVDMGCYEYGAAPFFSGPESLAITDITLGVADNGFIPVTLAFTYEGALNPAAITVRVWHDLADAGIPVTPDDFGDDGEGNAWLLLFIPATETKAFFRVEAVP